MHCVQILLCGFFVWVCGSLLCNGSTESDDCGCSKGWAKHDKSCYKIFTDRQYTWSQAREMCSEGGGWLAECTSATETCFITSMVRNANVSVWYAVSEDGCSMDHNQKALKLGSDNCTVMVVTDSGVSSELESCSSNYYAICERNVNQPMAYLHCFAVAGVADAGNGRNGTDRFPCLMNHTIMETSVAHPLQCCKACSKEPACRSFNLLEDLGMLKCHLNNATISQASSEDFTARPDCQNYEYNYNIKS